MISYKGKKGGVIGVVIIIYKNEMKNLRIFATSLLKSYGVRNRHGCIPWRSIRTSE